MVWSIGADGPEVDWETGTVALEDGTETEPEPVDDGTTVSTTEVWTVVGLYSRVEAVEAEPAVATEETGEEDTEDGTEVETTVLIIEDSTDWTGAV